MLYRPCADIAVCPRRLLLLSHNFCCRTYIVLLALFSPREWSLSPMPASRAWVFRRSSLVPRIPCASLPTRAKYLWIYHSKLLRCPVYIEDIEQRMIHKCVCRRWFDPLERMTDEQIDKEENMRKAIRYATCQHNRFSLCAQ